MPDHTATGGASPSAEDGRDVDGGRDVEGGREVVDADREAADDGRGVAGDGRNAAGDDDEPAGDGHEIGDGREVSDGRGVGDGREAADDHEAGGDSGTDAEADGRSDRTADTPRPALVSLALEVRDLASSAAWYADTFGLVPTRRSRTECAFDVGGTELVLRRPDSVPRGGLHTHFAFEVPGGEYPTWRALFPDAPEIDFGSFRSLYLEDADGHAPEIGGTAPDGAGEGPGLAGIFEVVFEVANVDLARDCWTDLGFATVDRGHERRRVRMRGPRAAERQFDVELWEPQLGLADARGGVHVDLAVRVREPAALAERAFGDLPSVTPREHDDGSVELYDPDGHHLVLLPADEEGGTGGR